tara:strand:- start:29 stop:799 length:771 start_codon:yes stop_codon:yes gene_type:complete
MNNETIYSNLKNKVVVISGGSQGIGKSIVEEFCKQKSKVYFLDIDEKGARKVINDLSHTNATIPIFFHCNIKDKLNLKNIINKIGDDNNCIDVLINNAANDERHTIEEVDEKFWVDRLDINLNHAFFATQASVKYLKKSKYPSVINFSSVSWHVGVKNLIAYQTAKAGIHGLTKGLARELGEFNIRVNAIVPGWIMTERQLKLWLNKETDKWRQESQCLPDRIYPIDVSKLALFLASPDSKMMTSQFYKIDAGWMN